MNSRLKPYKLKLNIETLFIVLLQFELLKEILLKLNFLINIFTKNNL